jgi:hypothetical protein
MKMCRSVVKVNEIDWRQEICEIWDMTGRGIDEYITSPLNQDVPFLKKIREATATRDARPSDMVVV